MGHRCLGYFFRSRGRSRFFRRKSFWRPLWWRSRGTGMSRGSWSITGRHGIKRRHVMLGRCRCIGRGEPRCDWCYRDILSSGCNNYRLHSSKDLSCWGGPDGTPKKGTFLEVFSLNWSLFSKEKRRCISSGGFYPRSELFVFLERFGRDQIPTFCQSLYASGLEMTP